MTHSESIQKGILERKPHNEIVRKVYLTYPAFAMLDKQEKQFEIFNEISEYFKIPINHVQIAGSAQTGFSFHKNTPFNPGVSDLDIAIIDPELFKFYSEQIFKGTKGYKNRSQFPIRSGVSTFNEYLAYISKGIFRPDLMTHCNLRAEWFMFFGKLSRKHNDLFESINCGIYFSQIFFEYKQSSSIREFLNLNIV